MLIKYKSLRMLIMLFSFGWTTVLLDKVVIVLIVECGGKVWQDHVIKLTRAKCGTETRKIEIILHIEVSTDAERRARPRDYLTGRSDD